MRPREILGRAPGLQQLVRPLDLASAPTPVTALPELEERWGLAALHVKRDDLSSPIYGGSKVRALEWLLGRAVGAGARTVATWGPWGSHHVLASALFARTQGLGARVVGFPQPPTPEVELNRRVLPALDVAWSRSRTWLDLLPRLALLRARATLSSTCWLPAGGTSPLGILGMVEGGLELARAVKEGSLPRPDDVLVPAGSCGTAAGLLLGLALGGLPVRVVAVRVVPRLVAGPRKVRRLAGRALDILRGAGLEERLKPGELSWVDAQAGRGYARPTEAARAAVAVMQDASPLRGETTYTGKALAALPGGLLRGRRVVFWNTYSAIDPLLPETGRGSDDAPV